MHDDQQRENQQGRPAGDTQPQAADGMHTLRLCFIAVIGVIVAAAFVTAWTYDLVSARTPIVIMIPLLILIALQIQREIAASPRAGEMVSQLAEVVLGRNETFNTVAGLLALLVVLMALIYFTGHYIGIAVFMFVLMRVIAEEGLLLSASVTAAVTLIIYILFDHAFEIELYEGMIFRLLS